MNTEKPESSNRFPSADSRCGHPADAAGHTAGPWYAESGNAIFSASVTERGIQGATRPKQVAAAIGEANAARIVACVNALEGLAVGGGQPSVSPDALRLALECVTGVAGRGSVDCLTAPTVEQWQVIVREARAALAKVQP